MHQTDVKRLPQNLYKFFWDVDPVKIDLQLRAKYVINRLLDKGDLEAARWVLKNYSKEEIIETFKTRRDFSPWNGTFWANFLGIPREEVACLEPSYRSQRKQLWPY